MASIRRRGERFQVQIRRGNIAVKTRTFLSLADAQKWALREESRIDDTVVEVASSDKLRDILEKYVNEITPIKKGAFQETKRISRLLRDPISDVSLKRLTGGLLTAFRDRRMKDGIRTCQYDLVLIRHIIEVARKEWGYYLGANPVNLVRIPNGVRKRDRRLTKEEAIAFHSALQQCWNPVFRALILLAEETGMRQSELLNLQWANVDCPNATLFLPDTKNGTPRVIPISERAQRILNGLGRGDLEVFPLTKFAIRNAWLRLIKRAGIKNYRFHDLRHEAISRFFELGLSVPEVALISGHKTPTMLFRYTHLRAEDVGKKLRNSIAAAEAKSGSRRM